MSCTIINNQSRGCEDYANDDFYDAQHQVEREYHEHNEGEKIGASIWTVISIRLKDMMMMLGVLFTLGKMLGIVDRLHSWRRIALFVKFLHRLRATTK